MEKQRIVSTEQLKRQNLQYERFGLTYPILLKVGNKSLKISQKKSSTNFSSFSCVYLTFPGLGWELCKLEFHTTDSLIKGLLYFCAGHCTSSLIQPKKETMKYLVY